MSASAIQRRRALEWSPHTAERFFILGSDVQLFESEVRVDFEKGASGNSDSHFVADSFSQQNAMPQSALPVAGAPIIESLGV